MERRFGLLGSSVIKFGIGYGAVAAMILSWSANKSILWMLIDGWLSWIYVIFYALFRT
jgi:prolipoprotein diacylglyceryltransferase